VIVAGIVGNLLRRAVVVREGEERAIVWAFLYFFFVLAAMFVTRPIRDTLGTLEGTDDLALMFTFTLIGTLILHPIYTSLVSRVSRRRFVPLTYRFFILNLVVFFFLLRGADEAQTILVGRVFFVWFSIFNLFATTVFWSFLTDSFRPLQSKRVFGLIAVGGTLGAVTGGSITLLLVRPLGEVNLLLVSALLLELAVRASTMLAKQEPALAAAAVEEELEEGREEGMAVPAVPVEGSAAAPASAVVGRAAQRDTEVIGGRFWDGVVQVFTSRYLVGIAMLMMFFSILSTFLYFQRIDIAARAFEGDQAGRTQLFAGMEVAAQSLTAILQLFVTGRLLRKLGVSVSLALLPVVSLVGFAILSASPVLGVVVVFEVIRRASNFAIQRPTREVLYTVLSREQKFKAKNFKDTFVYRFGDQTGAWSYDLLGRMGLGLSTLAFIMVPVSVVWLFLALALGRMQKKLQNRELLVPERSRGAAEAHV
jgi:AAA family ATP:ADP antiporter